MLALSAARKPAPMLARRALLAELHVRPNAFGNALGESLASGSSLEADQQRSGQEEAAFEKSQWAANAQGGEAAAGSGIRFGGGSGGMRLSGDAVDQWSRQTDTAIANEADRMTRNERFLAMNPTADASPFANLGLNAPATTSDAGRPSPLFGMPMRDWSDSSNTGNPDTAVTLKKVPGGVEVRNADGTVDRIADKPKVAWDAFSLGIQAWQQAQQGSDSGPSWWNKSLGLQDSALDLIHDHVSNPYLAGGLGLLSVVIPDTPLDAALTVVPELRAGGLLAERSAMRLGEQQAIRLGEDAVTLVPQSASVAAKDYGVAFFGSDNKRFYTLENATIGREGSSFFLMPLEDSAIVKNASDAARYTGRAPSAERAYFAEIASREGVDAAEAAHFGKLANGVEPTVYGLSFPTNGMKLSLPTAADAGGYMHFLEGGSTAVRLGDGPGAGYLVNPTRELVTPGGSLVPGGSVLFKVGPNGEWTAIRKF